MNEAVSVSKDDILRGLEELGVQCGDTLLVHSSMKSFGYVEGGPETVIAALREAVGLRGCIVVPTLTLGTGEAPVTFDVRNSPSTSGLLTNVFRQMPEARRSLHPTSSAAAIGWAADEITRHHGATPCGLTSPYGQVYLRGGSCVFLGAKFTSNTMAHVAEEIADLPYLRIAEFRDALLTDEQGVEHQIAFKRYNCYQSGVKRDLAAFEALYRAAGAVKDTQIGQSPCRLIKARDVIDITVDALTNHLDQFVSYQL